MKTTVALALLLVAVAAFGQATSIVDVYPLQGSTGGGDVVLIRLANPPYCDPGPCMFTVLFDRVPARSVSQGPDVLRVITPAHPIGDAEVSLNIGDFVVAKWVYKFRFAGPGAIDSPDPRNYEMVLVPLAVRSDQPVPGAFGSLWTSELWVMNSGDSDVEFFSGYPQCIDFPCGRFPVIPAHSSRLMTFPDDARSAGYLLYVQKGGAENIDFSLRVRDVSRSSENAGTELPVPRIGFEVLQRTTILNVPVEAASRTSLRIYSNANAVHLRVYRMSDSELVTDEDVPMQRGTPQPVPDSHGFPARSLYAQIAPELGEGRYRIEVTTAGSWVFALVTVTNNQTQLVTAISSSRNGRYGIIRL